MAQHGANGFKQALLRRTSRFSVGPGANERIAIGILVHRRDQPQAAQVLAARQARIDEHVRQVTADPAHDADLARLSFETGRAPDDDAGHSTRS